MRQLLKRNKHIFNKQCFIVFKSRIINNCKCSTGLNSLVSILVSIKIIAFQCKENTSGHNLARIGCDSSVL